MKRKIYHDLLNWKNSTNRKPLILQGARQVGKTYIVNLFGQKEYANVVYCNFEQQPDLTDFFEELDPNIIISKLSLCKHKEIIPGHTLIIFDEIQTCPQALTSLKYFCEDANQYHIIATGSLLGVSVNRSNSTFPVGKVDWMTMYPMDFEEFIVALKEEYSKLSDEIRKCYESNKPIDTLFHKLGTQLYNKYLYVGGMPEVVELFVKTDNYDLVRSKQKDIIAAYFNDMGKYNKATEIPKTKLIYQNISVQLAKENKKFKYKLLKTGARASLFEEATEWVCHAGIANKLYKLEEIKLPLEANKSITDFKFYMNDVGLCCASQNVEMQDILLDSLNDAFRGGLAENYVNNQLRANNLNMYYWTSKYDAEVDFITRLHGEIIPVEVKSSDNVRSRSLNVYMEQYNPKYAVRISKKNFGLESGIKSVPLYAVFCIK